MNIKRKVETAFAGYLSGLTPLAGLTIEPAHKTELQTFPLIVVHCKTCDAEGDLPPGVLGEYAGELVVQLITQTDDDEEEPHSDDRLGALESALADVAAIKAALNLAEGVTDDGDDTRAVQGFHLKDLFTRDQDETIQDRHFIDSLAYDIHVCNFDVAA